MKIKVPQWTFPNISDNGINWQKMKEDFESKGDYKASSRVALKMLVMKYPNMFKCDRL